MSKNRWPSIKELQNSVAGKSAKNAAAFNEPNKVSTPVKDGHFNGNTNRHSGNTAKDWMLFNLQHFCNERALTLETEFRFHKERKWRSDYALPGLFVLIEYEGIYSEFSEHTSIKGFNRNLEKYNAATIAGWKVLRYSNANYKDVLRDLTEIHYNKTIPF